MELLRPYECMYIYRDGQMNMQEFKTDLLPPKVFYKQLKEVKANGEKKFRPLDKFPPKQVCPLNNFLLLHEHFKKVMAKCLLPEDFGLEEFNEEFIQNIGILIESKLAIDCSKLWKCVTNAVKTFLPKYSQTSFVTKQKQFADHIL